MTGAEHYIAAEKALARAEQPGTASERAGWRERARLHLDLAAVALSALAAFPSTALTGTQTDVTHRPLALAWLAAVGARVDSR
jgi:hypothetical protein